MTIEMSAQNAPDVAAQIYYPRVETPMSSLKNSPLCFSHAAMKLVIGDVCC